MELTSIYRKWQRKYKIIDLIKWKKKLLKLCIYIDYMKQSNKIFPFQYSNLVIYSIELFSFSRFTTHHRTCSYSMWLFTYICAYTKCLKLTFISMLEITVHAMYSHFIWLIKKISGKKIEWIFTVLKLMRVRISCKTKFHTHIQKKKEIKK